MGIWDIVNCKERMENFELSRATLKYSGDFSPVFDLTSGTCMGCSCSNHSHIREGLA